MAIEAGYRGDKLDSVNVVRKSLHLIHVSDLVLCDGKTLDVSLTEGDLKTPLDSNVQFPVKKPTRKDNRIWTTFISSLSRDYKFLDAPLGDYISKPQARMDWTYDETNNILYHSNLDGAVYEVYTARMGRMEMRSGQIYEKTREKMDNLPVTITPP